MTIRTAAGERLRHVKELYRSAFPASEKKPFAVIRSRARKGKMEILAVETDEGRFAGLVFTVLHKDIVLLDYFAIAPAVRGHGAGSAVLQQLFARYPGRRFLLEIESTRGREEGHETVRRKHFYTANGMQAMDYLVDLFGVEMEIMTHDCTVPFADYHEIFGAVFGEYASERVKLIGENPNK